MATTKHAAVPTLITRLKGEHAEIETMMTSILAHLDSVAIADIHERQRVFEVVRERLMAHAKAEESVVYPAFELADGPVLENEIEQSWEDHNRIELLLERLHVVDPGSPRWAVAFDELHGLVNAHVREEETVVFPRACEAISDAEFEQLDERYQTVEAEVLHAVSTENEYSPSR